MKADIISGLDRLIKILSKELAISASDEVVANEVEARLGSELGVEAKKFLTLSSGADFLDDCELLLGYSPLSFADLKRHFDKDSDDVVSFYSDVSDDFLATDFPLCLVSHDIGNGVVLNFNDAGMPIQNETLEYDYSRFVPIANAAGFEFLLVDMKSENQSALWEYDASGVRLLAPSIVEYLRDLQSGVEKGVYPVVDEVILRPPDWDTGQLIQKGLYRISEDGAISPDA